jgi:RNA polymerase sigma-70 factor, ECF subfamily
LQPPFPLQHAPQVAEPPHLNAAQVFREHGAYAWRALRRLGVADSDIADVCQEVFVVVHRKLLEFEGRSQLRTWVYGICVYTASDYRKRARRRPEIATELLPEQVAPDNPASSLEGAEARATLDRILDTLDDDKRAVFVLFEIEQMPMTEVVAAVGCPLQTGYSRLHAARAHVQQAIARLQSERLPRALEVLP